MILSSPATYWEPDTTNGLLNLISTVSPDARPDPNTTSSAPTVPVPTLNVYAVVAVPLTLTYSITVEAEDGNGKLKSVCPAVAVAVVTTSATNADNAFSNNTGAVGVPTLPVNVSTNPSTLIFPKSTSLPGTLE